MANGPFFPGPLVPIFGPCTCVCVVRCFAQFSMACVQFRPRRAPATFFPCPRTARCWSVYAYVAPMLFCPVLHGARPVPSTTGDGHFFPVSPYRSFPGPCTCACPVRGFAQFCMSRVQLRARRASATFFPDSPYRMFKGPCRHMCTCVCLIRGFAQFCMARVQFRPHQFRALFCPVVCYYVSYPCLPSHDFIATTKVLLFFFNIIYQFSLLQCHPH